MITLLVITTPVEGTILVTHMALMVLNSVDGQKPRRPGLQTPEQKSAMGIQRVALLCLRRRDFSTIILSI